VVGLFYIVFFNSFVCDLAFYAIFLYSFLEFMVNVLWNPTEVAICVFSPLEQFNVVADCRFWANVPLFLVFLFLVILIIFEITLLASLSNKSWFDQIFGDLVFFIRDAVRDNLSVTKSIYFPYIFYLFFFILSANLLGMVPYTYTITSSFIIVFFLSLSTFIGICIIGYAEHEDSIWGLFLPGGAPFFMTPALVVIELISFSVRVFSLSIRLFSNMLSGHVLLKILAGVVWSLVCSFAWHFALIPLVVFFIITCLELVIACLQAYVFTILIVVYLNDVLNMH